MGKRQSISQGTRFDIFRRDGFTCRYCGRASPEVVLHLEHVKPVCEGGKDIESNFVTACQDCNSGKGRKIGVKPPAPAKKEPREASLVGLFGHTFAEDGGVHWQFEIIKKLPHDIYMIQLYSWLTGWKTTQESLPLAEIQRAKLYGTEEDWCSEGGRLHNLRFPR